ncbi:ISAs1 family transposase [Actinomyces sp. HMSC075C01]|uniref:ISAs1 family transposase n=1 Tax=Actinomyces sp. HMSC075C01 TaxID=1739387 RepID=UPI00210D44BD|nr:ISAs1 family transposase [Actinomyces sp. HMSC075C01]
MSADAMHTQADTAGWIRGRGGHYLLTPLDNHKTLRRTLKALPFKSVPSISWVDTSHGRWVRRTVKALEVPKWVDFPGSAQVVQVRRTRTVKGRKRVEVVYLVCSLPMTDAQPEAIAAWIQGHWGIENRLHWVRDVIFDEDRHQLRTRNGPQVMATLRNLATRPHPPGPRRPSRYRLNRQIPVTTTKTRHQAHHPANHLTRLCRPPEATPCRNFVLFCASCSTRGICVVQRCADQFQ